MAAKTSDIMYDNRWQHFTGDLVKNTYCTGIEPIPSAIGRSNHSLATGKLFPIRCPSQRLAYNSYLTLTGLEGHICPSLVRDYKDIYVPPRWKTGRTCMSLPGNGLKGHVCPTIVRSFRASWTWWYTNKYYIVVRGHELLKYGE